MACNIQPNFALSHEGIAGRVESRWTAGVSTTYCICPGSLLLARPGSSTARREYDLLCMPGSLAASQKPKTNADMAKPREHPSTNAGRPWQAWQRLKNQKQRQTPRSHTDKTKADTQSHESRHREATTDTAKLTRGKNQKQRQTPRSHDRHGEVNEKEKNQKQRQTPRSHESMVPPILDLIGVPRSTIASRGGAKV